MESTAASQRPIALRRRLDLTIHPQRLAGQACMVMKDPLTLRYYHLREEEFFLFELLDGTRSLQQLVEAFAARFAPRQLPVKRLQQFLSMLHREGLVVAHAVGQGDELLARNRKERNLQAWNTWSHPLAIRFRGIDPGPILDRLYPCFRWCFSPVVVTAVLLLILLAAGWIAVQAEAIANRLPGFEAFFTGANLSWFVLAIALVKVAHELSHGLVCRHFGGRCHELGVMFLVFTPCLYVNVSDAWLLPNRWHRVAISAAGMYAELTLASGCAFLWWFSEPGTFNTICLHLVFVCSVSTLVFNGNPLLRYDGYYILCDLTETPNLAERSGALLRQQFNNWFLGMPQEQLRWLPERHRIWLMLYAISAFFYRILVMVTILWLCYRVLQSHDLQLVGQALIVVSIVGWLAMPAGRLLRQVTNPLWRRQVSGLRLVTRGGFVAAMTGVLLAIPLPYSVEAPALLEPRDAQTVFAPISGTLQSIVEVGTPVEAGDVVAQLESVAVSMEVVRLQGECEVLRTELKTLQLRKTQFVETGISDVANRIPATKQALADAEHRLAKRQQELDRLTVAAPVGGTVLPMRRTPPPDATLQLPSWSGCLMDPKNRNAIVLAGTPLCQIGDPAIMDAVLVIDQEHVEFVREGQSVRFKLRSLPGVVLRGQIVELARRDIQQIPQELTALGSIPIEQNAQGAAKPALVYYQARVQFRERRSDWLPGMSGTARIVSKPRSLANRIARIIQTTFRLRQN